jgi:hypothetical protein
MIGPDDTRRSLATFEWRVSPPSKVRIPGAQGTNVNPEELGYITGTRKGQPFIDITYPLSTHPCMDPEADDYPSEQDASFKWRYGQIEALDEMSFPHSARQSSGKLI